MAVAWESRRDSDSGLPPEVASALDGHSDLRNPTLLLGLVEHRVPLDTKKTPSQNDLWCMLLTDSGQVSVAIEAKAGEDFDRRLSEWLVSDGEGKTQRLQFLCRTLGLEPNPEVSLRYQLFHRTASAVLEAKRWRVGKALMLVQSFSESRTSWQDYVDVAAQFRLSVAKGAVSGPVRVGDINLYLGWVESPLATDAVAGLAV